MAGQAEMNVLITGASRGIGRALVAEYLERGAHVFAVARSTAPGDGAGGPIEWIEADLSEPGGWDRVIDAVARSNRRIDILVNNAGIQQALDMDTIAHDRFRADAGREIALDMAAPIMLTQGLLPHMRRPGGTIVNVTSLLARQPKASAPVYCASKAGLASYTKALRHQLTPLGINVTEVVPPLVATDMTSGRGRGKLSPKAMAAAIVEGVGRGSKLIAPGLSRVMLAINRLSPELAGAMLAKG